MRIVLLVLPLLVCSFSISQSSCFEKLSQTNKSYLGYYEGLVKKGDLISEKIIEVSVHCKTEIIQSDVCSDTVTLFFYHSDSVFGWNFNIGIMQNHRFELTIWREEFKTGCGIYYPCSFCTLNMRSRWKYDLVYWEPVGLDNKNQKYRIWVFEIDLTGKI